MAVNWAKIRLDYINGRGNYRELSEKYGVSHSTLRQRAAREQWANSRAEQTNKTRAKIEQKTAEKIADTESDVAAIMSRIRLKLTQKIEQAVDNMQELDSTELRKLVQSFKDMNETAGSSDEDKNGALADILEAVRGVSND